MKLAALLLFACGACNAIDGADQYKKGDGGADASGCMQSCIDTSGSCLGDCATTRDGCKATCGTPGACMKCDSNYSSCTSGCISTCTSCGCTQSACEAAPVEAGADAPTD